jgi:hypothetical protein
VEGPIVKRLNIKLPVDEWAALERAHEYSGVPVTTIIRRAVAQFIRQPQFGPPPGERPEEPAGDRPGRAGPGP